MFYSAPYGTAFWMGFESIGNWIKDVPQMAGQRAIIIGMAVGLIAIFVRTILGLERAQLGEL
jgi:ABC-type dipeptide/oligopeptide/nickel transport system permease subunit